MNVQQRSAHKHQSCSAQAIGQQMHVLQLIVSMRSVDHGCWLSRIGTGMRAFILWTGTRSVIEVFSRGPGRAACVGCVEVLRRVVLHTRLHELQLSAYNCTFCYIGSGFYTDAQTLRQQQVVRMALQSCSLITPARSSVCCKGISVFQCPLGMRQ